MNEEPSAFARGSRRVVSEDHVVVIYSRIPERLRWMETELARGSARVAVARDVAEVVELVIGARRSHPQMLVIDLDTLSGGELFHIHRIREAGWGGPVFALGKIPISLRASLGIERTLPPPYIEDALRDEIEHYLQGSTAPTTPIPIPI